MPVPSPLPAADRRDRLGRIALALFAIGALAGCEGESAEADAGPPDAAGPDMSDAIQCIVDADCPDGQICDAGQCAAPPECDCPAVVDVVCGVDGVEYDNACRAGCAGISVSSEGPCPEPCPCDDVLEPVCGADGATYDNPCRAECAAVAVEHPGRCGERPCGQGGLDPCPDDSFCDLGDACGADEGGLCRPRPADCPAVVAPVCGCDEQTYDSACSANAAGASVAAEGPCPDPCGCPDEVVPVCGADGHTYINACRAECAMVAVAEQGPCPVPCVGGAGTCEDDQWCDAPGCGAEGLCRPRPRRCDADVQPVCACDGTTHRNACEARAAGATTDRDGPCDEGACSPAECGPQPGLPNYRCDDGSIGGPTGQCIRDEEDVCGWEIRDCPDAPEPVPCGARLGDTCAADQFCDFARDGCDFADATGTCRPQPVDCGDAFQPVCGCDGQTYDSPCLAHADRTDVARLGLCDDDAGQACDPGACGPPPGLPNVQCEDGSMGGPTGRCLRGADNRCGWEVRACP